MDWYVANTKGAARQLRREFTDYLTRHAAPGSDLQAAALILSELVTNAIEKSEQPAWVSLNWGSEQPVLTINDLGPGFALPDDPSIPEPSSPRGRGLMIVTHLTDELGVAAKAAGGARVTATLPVRRAESRSFAIEPLGIDQLLPAAEEIDEDGRFDRESFLRALVVQLAQLVERESGPLAAEHLVTQVGAGVGYRMEEAFRRTRGREDGALTVEELGELFVELKAAIDGDFFVVEATEDRIVLGNRQCPFGEAVKYAPALCRMTSSVFGGIGARSRDGVAVHLEERIAVGDPECRVTVWLRPPPESIVPETHFYPRPGATG